MVRFVALACILCSSVQAFANGLDTGKIKVIKVDEQKTLLTEQGSLPKILKEASGLETTANYLWSHNDDGIPALYCINDKGELIRAVQLNTINRGWEDLTTDDQGNLYIGAFGNNKNDKQELKIYRIPHPESITAPMTEPEIIQYHYSDQKAFPPDATNRNYDVDAFFEWNQSLYLFTKNRSTPFRGYSKVYKLPAHPGKHVAELIDSIYVGDGPMLMNWITSADLSPDKKTLALLLHDRVLFIKNFTVNNFSKGKFYQLNLNHFSHKAGLCYKDGNTIMIVDELEMQLIGGKLYSIDLSSIQPQLNR